jgi:predicted metal-dependent hydrolase
MRSDEEEAHLAQLAYALLFNKANDKYIFTIHYSGKFKSYNANARKVKNNITFSLSNKWKEVNPEIVIGLLQHLLLRIEKKKKANTVNIDLYNNFIRNLHLAQVEKTIDPELSTIFDKINAQYFNGMLEKPSLVWEGEAKRTLATYNFHDDTIRISKVFKDAPNEILEFLVYHESLHKFLKFKEKGQRMMHHTTQFRSLESMFKGYNEIDKKISEYLKSRQRRQSLWKYFEKGNY